MANEIKNSELHRIVLTAIIYNDKGQFLITKRSKKQKAFPGQWTVAGGGLEAEDYKDTKPTTSAGQWYYALENTLKREVKEEVNLEIGKPQYLLDLIFIRPDGIPVVVLSYYAPYESGEVALEEGELADTDFAWVTYEEAKDYDLIDGILEEIKMVDDILKKESKILN